MELTQSQFEDKVTATYYEMMTDKLVKELEDFFNEEGVIIDEEVENRLRIVVKSFIKRV